MMMIGFKILQFGSRRRRQLHTIISRQLIKPSSPTPSHLHSYNLSQLDQYTPHVYTPLILFYPNHASTTNLDEKARRMKKSLSQSLTRYYPFAGRLHSPTTTSVDCNDEGVVFVEAENTCQMDKFRTVTEEEKEGTVGQLFADGMVWQNCPHRTDILAIQLNRFTCGGMAVAVSLSHRIGDGCTLSSFVRHWAAVARYGSIDHEVVLPLNPRLIKSPNTTNSPPPQSPLFNQTYTDYVTRKFVFPNSKLNDLKNKVIGMAEPGSTLSVNNLTRFEVLSSLLYKTAIAAATAKSGLFKPAFLVIPVDMRKRFVPKLTETTVGNFVGAMMVNTRHESETSLGVVVSEIKKGKMALDRVQSVQLASQHVESFLSRLGNEDLENFGKRSFWCSSLCGLPYHKVDFGWGKPAGVTTVYGSSDRASSVLMDTPNGDGIEAQVVLEKQYMQIFQSDKEMLSFCQM